MNDDIPQVTDGAVMVAKVAVLLAELQQDWDKLDDTDQHIVNAMLERWVMAQWGVDQA